MKRTRRPKRTRVRFKRPGPPRRGRLVDPDFLAWMVETQVLCAVWQFTCLGECSKRLTTHHVREFGSPKNDREAIRLCEAHHLHDFGMFSIERIGKAKFEQRTGLSIRALIVYYNEAYEKQKSNNVA